MGIGIAMIAGGTALSAFSKFTAGGKAAEDLREQAMLARLNAFYKRLETSLNVAQVRKKGKRALSRQRTQYGGAGVTLDWSPMEVAMDTAREIEWDAQRVRITGEFEARNLEAMAQSKMSQASAVQAASTWDALATITAGMGSAIRMGGGLEIGFAKPTPTSVLT